MDSSVDTLPVVLDDEAQRDTNNHRSDLQDSDSSAPQDNNLAVSTFGGTSTVHGGADTSGLGATDLTVSGTDANDETVTDTGTSTLIVDLPPSSLNSQDAGASGDPVPSLTSIDLESGQLLDVDLSTNGPITPPLPGVMLGSLDQVRRDLEKGFNSGSVTLAATVQAAPPPPSWEVPDDLTVALTSAERTAAFQKAQAQRIGAFNEAQAARVQAFNEQMASTDPVGALLNSAAFVVSELVNTAAVVVTEFVNYISFGITQFIQGISDWFTTPVHFTGLYGDPEANKQYHQTQKAENCVLQSMAMVINQLKETPVPDPNEEAIAQLATETQSVADPDEKMYKGLYELDANGQYVLDENGERKTTEDRVDIKDGLKLLDMYGVSADLTKYDKSEGNLALRALAFALRDGKAVSVGVQGSTIWNSVANQPLPTIASADHQIVVTGVDFDERVVYLNDTGLAAGTKVDLNTFMRAWQSDNYETVIATLKVPNTSASGVTSTNFSGSTVLVGVG
ncbi:hypothetical protein AB4Z42_24740 [Mycobacterium sp. 2YAF39]|uniref:hypothetical protein n=1 Tax=Mycobacterium sp. 2YAF39 TaxID=3233033 RepID=UPI003F98FBD3